MAEQAKASDGSDKIQEITDEEAEKIKGGGETDDFSHDLTADDDDQDKLTPGTMMPNSGNGGENLSSNRVSIYVLAYSYNVFRYIMGLGGKALV